ncbi:MAG TPA: DUF4252 domain-containing protein [Chitinophagales bacterium]|nr:DUF4252 domain-containing protein [Chitinophagales bacterium]
MKKLMIAAAMFGISGLVSAQTVADVFFSRYEGKDGFTSVSVSEKMFDMLATAAPADEIGLKEMAAGLKGIKVLSYENLEGSLRSRELYKEAEDAISLQGFSELMQVFDEGEKVRILTKDGGDSIIEELLILVSSDEEFVLVDLFGNIDLNKVSEWTRDMDIKGLDQLNRTTD